MIGDSIKILDEEKLLAKYGFAKTNYNGLMVYFNPHLKNHYFESRNSKSLIVGHHTAGGFEGDLMTLLLPEKISTAFLISPQGRIVMLFRPWNWAYHLGGTALGGNTIQSKRSIGIEISNWGFLIRKENILYTYKGRPYCHISQTDMYDKETPWVRPGLVKCEYFAKYSEEQYKSFKTLKDLLCKLYGIPNQLYPKIRETYSREVVNFNGVTTHINFRKDKYDLSPNFDWEKVFDDINT
jgi:N-acetylmuramoyl-L-alanine amidase